MITRLYAAGGKRRTTKRRRGRRGERRSRLDRTLLREREGICHFLDMLPSVSMHCVDDSYLFA